MIEMQGETGCSNSKGHQGIYRNCPSTVTMNCAVNSSEIGLLRSAIFSSTSLKYLSERGDGQEL